MHITRLTSLRAQSEITEFLGAKIQKPRLWVHFLVLNHLLRQRPIHFVFAPPTCTVGSLSVTDISQRVWYRRLSVVCWISVESKMGKHAWCARTTWRAANVSQFVPPAQYCTTESFDMSCLRYTMVRVSVPFRSLVYLVLTDRSHYRRSPNLRRLPSRMSKVRYISLLPYSPILMQCRSIWYTDT